MFLRLWEGQAEFLVKRLHRYCGTKSLSHLKTIVLDSLPMSSSMVFQGLSAKLHNKWSAWGIKAAICNDSSSTMKWEKMGAKLVLGQAVNLPGTKGPASETSAPNRRTPEINLRNYFHVETVPANNHCPRYIIRAPRLKFDHIFLSTPVNI